MTTPRTGTTMRRTTKQKQRPQSVPKFLHQLHHSKSARAATNANGSTGATATVPNKATTTDAKVTDATATKHARTNHAKTAVIDGVVSTVGSSNMDWRSLVQNSEVNAMVYGEAFGDSMTRMFRADVAASAAITLAAWRERPLADRALEGVARLFEGFW